MSITQTQQDIPLKKIRAIRFGVLSPELIKNYAVAEIVTSELYDEAGLPRRGGLADRRLGVIEPYSRCETCGNSHEQCPGHFGYIELRKPVINVVFARVVHDLLRTTCPNCGRIMLKDEEIRRFRERMERLRGRWRVLLEHLVERIKKRAAERDVCPHCGYRRNRIRFERPYYFYEETEEGALIKLDPEVIRERLAKIPDEDLELLDIDPRSARPEWMVWIVMPVPPPHVRPSIQLEGGIRAEDDLTHKLTDILRTNEKLKIALESGAPSNVVDSLWELLQYHVATYLDNELPGIPPAKHRSGKLLKGLSQRLKGKEGRFRGSLSGKRVNFSARTVISPDPNIDINEVGVPVDIAKILTVPEKVTEWNIETLREAVVKGPENWPGANYVITPDGRKIDLRYVRDRRALAEKIQPGWVVERHIRDGDIALFNRQPTLHRPSMMGHIVRVLPGRTFRIHLAVCPPYNADFDGDEMNLHIPQTEEARAEAKLLMLVQNHIMSPRYGGPLMGARQDYIMGGYMLTRKDTFLDRLEVAFLVGATRQEDLEVPEPAILHPVELWTGKQLVSLLLPKDLNWVQATAMKGRCRDPYLCDYDEYIVVVNGYMATGVLDKKSIGAEQVDSLWHRIARDYPPSVAARWLNSTLRMLLRFIDLRGLTMSTDSLDLPREAYREIEAVKEKYLRKAWEYIHAYVEGRLEAEPGYTVEETLENKLSIELSRIREDAAQIVEKYIRKDSEAYLMAKTGARGSIVNIVQMVGVLGQQTIRGERIKRGYSVRILPHFPINYRGPETGGFVAGNFRFGLTPIEYFYHAAAGRDGLIDTAVRTAQSGYMQRRLINALQDLYVAYDGTVRLANKTVVQLLYGEDGVDVSRSDHGKAVNLEQLLTRISK